MIKKQITNATGKHITINYSYKKMAISNLFTACSNLHIYCLPISGAEVYCWLRLIHPVPPHLAIDFHQHHTECCLLPFTEDKIS